MPLESGATSNPSYEAVERLVLAELRVSGYDNELNCAHRLPGIIVACAYCSRRRSLETMRDAGVRRARQSPVVATKRGPANVLRDSRRSRSLIEIPLTSTT
jgi:hypothetical protein